MPLDSHCNIKRRHRSKHQAMPALSSATFLILSTLAVGWSTARAETVTPSERSAEHVDSKPGPLIVQTIVGPPSTLNVSKAPARRLSQRRKHVAHYRSAPIDVDRPALAGVELLRPLPPPGQPPHFVVPTPAYPFENFVTAYTTPPAPLFCHPTSRDRDLPDPHLYRERPVTCEPDNP